MRRLQDLGFIDSKLGLAIQFQFVLLLNSYLTIAKLYDDEPKDVAFNALLSQMVQVGASDLGRQVAEAPRQVHKRVKLFKVSAF